MKTNRAHRKKGAAVGRKTLEVIHPHRIIGASTSYLTSAKTDKNRDQKVNIRERKNWVLPRETRKDKALQRETRKDRVAEWRHEWSLLRVVKYDSVQGGTGTSWEVSSKSERAKDASKSRSTPRQSGEGLSHALVSKAIRPLFRRSNSLNKKRKRLK